MSVAELENDQISYRQQLRALIRAAKYRPGLTAAIIIGGALAAGFEAVGVSFILPIVEIVQASGNPTQQTDGIMKVFVSAYQLLGIPFTLGTVVAGVSVVLTVRWTSTFVIRWLSNVLVVYYMRKLQTQAFDYALDARVEYFDQEGSDDILNAIVTQAEYASNVISNIVSFVETGLLSLVYFTIALTLAPLLTVLAIAFLGVFSVIFRYGLESGYDIGDRIADANEQVQQSAQAGTQGIRDTKLFGLRKELYGDFLSATNQYVDASIKRDRNQIAITNFYNLLTAVSVFGLIYFAITYANLSLGSLGVFLFAMFRLGPKASTLNSTLYSMENSLPHLIRTQQFINELKRNQESMNKTESAPSEVQTVTLNDVHFSYQGQDKEALSGISLGFEKGEFIGFVGQSGAGKSTIVSLLARLYEPDSGEIRANGRSIHEMATNEWRDRIAVVRQDPFIFNDTLRYNLTIGNRSVSDEELDRVARIAKINEFFDELPAGYESQLGDQGVRLSGGQRQRVALARALLKDADVLVLDEATSDLDSTLEKEVQMAIENLDRDYSIIGIAHRLSTIRNADRIYTIDSGEIIETGPHEQLIENRGQYAQLYNVQSQS